MWRRGQRDPRNHPQLTLRRRRGHSQRWRAAPGPRWPMKSEEKKAQEPGTHTHREFFFSVPLRNI